MDFSIKFIDNWYYSYNFILQEREWVFVFLKYLLQIVEKKIINTLKNLKSVLL
jgi:hypothetical protein